MLYILTCLCIARITRPLIRSLARDITYDRHMHMTHSTHVYTHVYMYDHHATHSSTMVGHDHVYLYLNTPMLQRMCAWLVMIIHTCTSYECVMMYHYIHRIHTPSLSLCMPIRHGCTYPCHTAVDIMHHWSKREASWFCLPSLSRFIAPSLPPSHGHMVTWSHGHMVTWSYHCGISLSVWHMPVIPLLSHA